MSDRIDAAITVATYLIKVVALGGIAGGLAGAVTARWPGRP